MQAGGAGDRDRALLDHTSSASLSLKARETASLSLKRIFERAQQQQQQQLQRSSNSTITSSTSSPIQCTYDSYADMRHVDDEWRAIMQPMADPDLDLKLAPTSTSYKKIHNRIDERINVGGGGHLTIFYAGTVCVYEDISADKAQAILLLASGASAGDSYRANYTNSYNAACIKSRPPTPPLQTPALASRPAKACSRSQAELPFARKASLARFLKKRKERVEEKVVVANKPTTSSAEPPQKRPRSASPTHQ